MLGRGWRQLLLLPRQRRQQWRQAPLPLVVVVVEFQLLLLLQVVVVEVGPLHLVLGLQRGPQEGVVVVEGYWGRVRC